MIIVAAQKLYSAQCEHNLNSRGICLFRFCQIKIPPEIRNNKEVTLYFLGLGVEDPDSS